MPSLAPEFLYDLFVSYAHRDTEKSGDALLKTWSQAFAKELRDELHTLPGWEELEIFLDEGSIDRSDPLTQQLRASVVQSAILLVLMSPQYLKSKACEMEREWWFQKTASESFPEVRSRVLVARIWPLGDEDVWPKVLCDELGQPPIGTWFHQRPGDPIKSRPFGWPNSTRTNLDFRTQLVELAGDIAVRLGELKKSIERKRQVAADMERLGASHGQAIYVHARGADAERWEAVCNELLSVGYGVAPDRPESFPATLQQASEIESETLRTLVACDGLLLVSGDDPARLASDLVVVGHRRRNSARASSSKPLPCAVVDRGLIVGPKSRLQLSAKNMQIDWIDASSSNWTQRVKPWLNAAAQFPGGTP